MNQSIYTLQRLKKLPEFDELDENSFIWLPLRNVPIDEHYPINSMRQPVLKVFNLLTWTAIGPLATSEQKFMHRLALEHNEMGYFLIHYQDIFGIIGVDEYYNSQMLGRAVVFNASSRTSWNSKDEISSTMLELVYSKMKYPCNEFVYTRGSFSNYSSIHHESDYARDFLDD